MTPDDLPLAGIRILAIEQMQALPYATQLLARLGADVVRVEPLGGEPGRMAAPLAADPWGRPLGSTFLRNNLSKRSIAIDLKHPEGHALFLAMAPRFDVVAQNFRPDTAARLRVDFATVAGAHPEVVYCAVSGFGTEPSPYSGWAAYACVGEAMGSLYDFKRQPDAAPVVSPLGALGDTGTGLFATIGILAALRRRDRSGEAQEVDVAMYDSMVAFADAGINYSSMGIDDAGAVPIINHAFQASDGFFVLMCNRVGLFGALARLVGHPEWVDDPRFARPSGWVTHLDDVVRPGIEAWARGRTSLEAADALAGVGLAAGPVHSPRDVRADPHVQRRRMVTPVPGVEWEGEPIVTVGNPVKVVGSDDGSDTRPPWLGEHTRAVAMADGGLDADDVARLVTEGVLGDTPA